MGLTRMPWHFRCIGAVALLLALLLLGCGRYRPVPAAFDPEAYKPATVQDLRSPGAAGLSAGQQVMVPAYFWQFLIYDPAMLRNYLTLLRHPRAWPRLEWCAVYGTPRMEQYFDRIAMDREQRRTYTVRRLDHVRLYGELASMGSGLLYLRVHRLENLED
jgi:hypothetical protein